MTEKMDAVTLRDSLRGFSGTEAYHQLSIIPNVVATDGVKYLCENARCFWLFDVIATHLGSVKSCARQYGEVFTNFHVWTITKVDEGAIVEARVDSGEPALITQEFEYTTFPFDETGEFKLFVAMQPMIDRDVFVVMLPGEY